MQVKEKHVSRESAMPPFHANFIVPKFVEYPTCALTV